jgi:hypothetical protein
MPQLPPTIHERLARCGTEVYLTGLITGAAVELRIDGTTQTFTATGHARNVTVPPLSAGARVTARQNDGSGFTPPSPPVIVEDAAVPPTAAPLLPSQVGSCSQCLRVSGMVPGCDVDVFQSGNPVGNGRVGRDGAACVGVNLRRVDVEEDVITARMVVCGSDGPLASRPLLPDFNLPRPVVGGPLFGCQALVPLSGLRLGAKTRIETDTGTFLGWICNCWTAVNVWVLHRLVPGERVRAQQYWDSDQCRADSPWSNWQVIVPPDERIKPVVQEALVEGDQVIRVGNQIGGADLVVMIRPDPTSSPVLYGPRPAGEEPEIALGDPLVAGSQVAVEQRLCGHVEVSDWVTVLPKPPVVLAPIVLPPLFECAGAVQVSGLHPGATVRVFCDGFPCGLGWAGLDSSVTVATAPALVAGTTVTAKQWVGGVESPPSAGIPVQALEELHRPRVIGPVADGDRLITVSGVTPGALVSILSGSELLGERFAGESLTRVETLPVPGPVHATVRLCNQVQTSDRVIPITSPGAIGPEAGVGEVDVDYGTFVIPNHPIPGTMHVDGGFSHPIRGRLYYPADANGKLIDSIRNRPLVVVAHGYWDWDEEDKSHLGYAYLARHLARWGAFVLSIDLAGVNQQTSIDVP